MYHIIYGYHLVLIVEVLAQEIQGYTLFYWFIGKYKREKWVTAISFITLDYIEYDRMKMQVGRFLKQHALSKVHSKYASYDEKVVEKPEHTYEEYSAADAAVQYSSCDLDF
jgi:hypothetical protein